MAGARADIGREVGYTLEKSPVYHRADISDADVHTHKCNLEPPVHLTCISLDFGRIDEGGFIYLFIFYSSLERLHLLFLMPTFRSKTKNCQYRLLEDRKNRPKLLSYEICVLDKSH